MPGKGKPFQKGEGGRKPGSKNKKTIALERVYQRCCAVGFHPADYLIEVARDERVPRHVRIEVCKDLIAYFEGKQPESKPLSPIAPQDSVDAAKAAMEQLTKLSEPLEPTNAAA